MLKNNPGNPSICLLSQQIKHKKVRKSQGVSLRHLNPVARSNYGLPVNVDEREKRFGLQLHHNS